MSSVEPRFEVDKVIQFRPRGSRGWQLGRTVNVSRSGLLFASEERLEVGAAIELRLHDYDRMGREINGRLCAAEVVRQSVPPFPGTVLIGIRFAPAEA